MHAILFSLYMRFQLGASPAGGTVTCAIFPFRVGFRLFVCPPRHDDGLREVFDVGFPCHSACNLLQFAFLRLPPPRHAGRSRGVFHGRLPYHSAFFVSPLRTAGSTRDFFEGGLPYRSAFFVSPPATLAVRRRFLSVVCLITVSAFPSVTFLCVFPGFIAKPSRGVGVGFEEPHLRLMF